MSIYLVSDHFSWEHWHCRTLPYQQHSNYHTISQSTWVTEVHFLSGKNLLLDLTLALPTPAPSNSLAFSSSSGNGSSGRAVRRTTFCFTSCNRKVVIRHGYSVHTISKNCHLSLMSIVLGGVNDSGIKVDTCAIRLSLDPFFTARSRSSQVHVTL